MFSFAYFLNDAVTRSLALKATKSVVKRLALFYFNFTHLCPSLRK